MALPLKLDWEQAQTKWKSQIDPVLANPMTNMTILKNIPLLAGANTINHRLGRMQQGWMVLDIDAAVTVYRSTPLNTQTITLTASGPATISLGVF